MRHAWGVTAIALGTWEALAITTHRCPTITTTVRMCRARNELATRAVLAMWTAGLIRHFLTNP